MGQLSHLDELEAEAIYIIREVAAECEDKDMAKQMEQYIESMFAKK